MKLKKSNFIKDLNNSYIFEKNPSVAIAVSGGPDSMALLFLIFEWAKSTSADLTILIVNHKLRINIFFEINKITKLLKIYNHKIKILNVHKSNIKKKSMKEARDNRYELLTNYCKNNNIFYLFIGHHQDDNLETFLLRKISGSDFDGLYGMKEKSLRDNTLLIRPLLKYKKKDIYDYNIRNNVNFIEDPSNIDHKYSRPVIRQILNQMDSKFVKSIVADHKKIVNNFNNYNNMVNKTLFDIVFAIKQNLIIVNFNKFTNLDQILAEIIVKKIYLFFYKNDFVRLKKVQIFLKNLKNQNFKIFNLKKITIRKNNNSLCFSRK